uniref:Uncharacterized protein n=1 Tax=Arundo donax TaxID=35708 RepID=A0A0A9H379_ARUDO
MGVMKAQI